MSLQTFVCHSYFSAPVMRSVHRVATSHAQRSRRSAPTRRTAWPGVAARTHEDIEYWLQTQYTRGRRCNGIYISLSFLRILSAVVHEDFPQTPAKEIVVAIQRDTTVTFDDRSESDHKHDTRRRPYRYHPQSPTSSQSQFAGLLSTISSKLNNPIASSSSREPDWEFGSPPRSLRDKVYPV